ncbi:MAG: trypsin-like peptidase domain-containing protein [Candidatus Poribacteria bacterium]|nr:trypsin-like peptidase domain-containing protein [Candidatus Poribacteria bacterium]
MYKKLFLISIFVTAILTLAQFAAADYTLTNGTRETVWVAYSRWLPANGNWPEGWRTQGWSKIEPGQREVLRVPLHNPWVYIRVINTNGEVKPPDHATRDKAPFWIHPVQPFTVVETPEGDFLKSDRVRENLRQANFYEYRNRGLHTIIDVPWTPDISAQQIYDQAMPSVVWIQIVQSDGSQAKGSGALIDRKRKLVVTNEHVVRGAQDIYVFFPWQDTNGYLRKNIGFYLENRKWLEIGGYMTNGRVIAQDVRDDLAILQLADIPANAREIKHDFSRNIEDSMREGDKVHILGNPEDRLWNWTVGTFQQPWRGECLPSGGACLIIEADVHPGNSGGPVLNGQGRLIGILTAGTEEAASAAAPARNVKALLNSVPAILPAIPPQQVYPKRTFKIINDTGVTVPYQIKWSNNSDWAPESLETGFIMTLWSGGQNIPPGYPKIRFDHIAGDAQVTYRVYNLETAIGNTNVAPMYRFEFNQRGDRLDLYRDGFAAPALSTVSPEETTLSFNYPNPFNPETWIPYQLSKPAEVTVTIHAADGRLIRTLVLGHQPAGIYQSKSRAAYWDGKNELGESVASGVYFYTLKAGDFTATRKMLIRK